MARGRMIDKRISKSKKLASLKFERSRTLYFMILPHLDCEGRYSGDPEEIKEDCVPKLRFSVQQVAESVVDLANVRLLLLYEHEEEPFIQYSRFGDFQVGIRKDREAPSAIPSPLKVRSSSGVTPSLYLSLRLRLRKEGNIKKEISFSFEERKFFNITIEDKAGWKDAYPAVDIDQELRAMREWLLANPEKRKKNYRRFIANWLSRTQDKGGTRIEYKTSQVGRDTGKHEEKFPSKFLHEVYSILRKQKKDINKYGDLIFSLDDEQVKVVMKKLKNSPGDFIEYLEQEFKMKVNEI